MIISVMKFGQNYLLYTQGFQQKIFHNLGNEFAVMLTILIWGSYQVNFHITVDHTISSYLTL